MKVIIQNAVRRAIMCLLASAFFAFIHWLWGIITHKDNEFLRPFLVGALFLFIVFTLIAVVSFIIEVIRLRRDPEYMKMKERIGISWKEYKKIKDGRK